MKKTYSQLQFELSQLLYLQNSRFGNSESSLEEQWKIQTRIGEVRNQIKELKLKQSGGEIGRRRRV